MDEVEVSCEYATLTFSASPGEYVTVRASTNDGRFSIYLERGEAAALRDLLIAAIGTE